MYVFHFVRFKGELVFTFRPSVKVTQSSSVKSPVTSLALSCDDTHLVVGLKIGVVLVVNMISGETLRSFEVSSKPVISLALVESEEEYV